MTIYLLELPGWQFDASAESAGVYRLTARRDGVERFTHTGTDTAALLEQCREEAEKAEGRR